jgi:hypothetical protein
MDAAAQLALMVKARKVFGAASTFLSFPVTPLPFAPGDLDLVPSAVADADEVRRVLANQQEFATLTNLIPEGPIWLPTDSNALWDECERVFADAIVAESSRTVEEERRYAEARAFLRVPTADGGEEESPAATAYREHRDMYFLAQQEYLAAKSTAETSTDSATVSNWRSAVEPALRARLAEVATAWIVTGFRNQVEAAQTLVETLGSRSPLQRWAEWREQFVVDIDAQTGASDGARYFPTSFAPSNAIEEGAWKPFRLEQAEVEALIAEVPAEERERLTGGKATQVQSLAFEFSSAVIVRPWFAPDALRARVWKLPPGEPALSDGAEPPQGTLPAYVTAVVFARRVIVTTTTPTAAPPRFDGFRFESAFPLEMVQGMQLKAQTSKALSVEALRVAAPVAKQADQPITGFTASAGLAVSAFPASGSIAHALDAGTVKFLAAQPAPAPAPAPAPSPDLKLAAIQVSSSPAIKALRVRDFRRKIFIPPVLPPISAGETAPTPPPPPPAGADPDTIYVLAFICKLVGKSPDPDPGLTWD